MTFEESNCVADKKLTNFSKYVSRQSIARFLAQSKIFKLQFPAKGSIVECGVHHGEGVMTWTKVSPPLELFSYHI